MVVAEDGGQAASNVLAEDQIKHLSRNVRALVPEKAGAKDEDTGNILQLLGDVFATASSATITASHKVAAWNTLCAFLDRISDFEADSFRRLLWSYGIWKRAFDLYLSQAHFVKPKSSRQLLVSLTVALRKAENGCPAINPAKSDAVRSLVHGLALGEDQGHVKTCAQALATLLAKEVLELEALLDAMPLSGGANGPASVTNLLLVLFRWMSKADFGATIGQLVSAVLDRSEKLVQKASDPALEVAMPPVWSSALKGAAKTGAGDVPSLRVHLLPVLFKRSAHDYISFIFDLGIQRLGGAYQSTTTQSTGDHELLYASLQTGKDLGFLQESESRQLSQDKGVIYVPVRWLGSLLQHASTTARSTGLSLLTNSQSSTRPILPTTMKLIKRSLGHLFADTDADFRSDVSGQVQRLLDRIRAITAVLARQSTRAHDGSGPAPAVVLVYHRRFVAWLLRFTVWQLRPTASYQRHISGLKCLSVLVRSGLDQQISSGHLSKQAKRETHWPFSLTILTDDCCQSLLDLLVDPFDDVRQAAASILATRPTSNGDEAQLRLALGRAEDTMLTTGRADQADGVAHAYSLLHSILQQQHGSGVVLQDLSDKLEQMLIIAKSDLPKAVRKYPLHGLLTSIRYVLTKGGAVQHSNSLDRMTPLLQAVWDVVKPILCNDAPEGYLPEGFEEVGAVSTKDTLSYCWRALKEASLLMGVLVSITAKADNQGKVLCELSFTQLAELRHRGAFSTVAQTWIACCLQPSSQAELGGWYDRTLFILRNKTTINTRRSAGLPSLLCGILVADQSGQFMQQAFNDLEAISREPVDPAFAQEGSLPQVHAMNCCKDILKNSRLGEQSEKHVPSALQLAADALQSHAWAVRNCGLMLFRAVIDRLLGTSDAHLEEDTDIQKKLSTEQHPHLLGIVLGLLSIHAGASTASQQTRQEGVFPALQLLQRLAIPADRLIEVQHSVRALMKSTSWHIRDKAARTYASFVSPKEVLPELPGLLRTSQCNQNAMHGALLAAKYILRSSASRQEHAELHGTSDGSKASAVSLVAAAANLYTSNACPITRAAYLDLYTVAIQLSIASGVQACPHTAETCSVLDRSQIVHEIVALASQDQRLSLTNGAVLRTPLAILLATQLFSHSGPDEQDAKRIGSCVAQLAKVDADAAELFFATGRDLGSKYTIAAGDDTRPLSVLAQAAAHVLQDPNIEVRVVCAAQELLIAICTVSRQHNLRLDDLSAFADAMVCKHSPAGHNSNQHSANLSVKLYGAMLELNSTVDVTDKLMIQWAEACCSAIDGTGLQSREAAAVALSETTIWRHLVESGMQQTLLSLCFAVYDLLNDDDEEIRLLTSHTLSNILCAGDQRLDEDLVPLVASTRLLNFMLVRWRNDPRLIVEAFIRAFALTDSICIDLQAELLAQTRANTALFAEEKQNLYIDEAREVKVWSQVLLHVPWDNVLPSYRQQLALWVQESLQILLDKAHATPDGPLGWSADLEVFVLGLRLLYGAEVLLRWVQSGARIQVRPSMLRRMLFELASIKAINVLWRWEIERILGESVVGNVRQLHSRLSASGLLEH